MFTGFFCSSRYFAQTPIKVVLRRKRRASAFQIFCPIQNSLRSDEVMSIWFFFKKIFFQKTHFQKNMFCKISKEILNKIKDFQIFDFFDFFVFFKNSTFSEGFRWKFSFCQKIWKNIFYFIFQITITSSDLTDFWIGQKIWRAVDLLFLPSTTFMGLRWI